MMIRLLTCFILVVTVCIPANAARNTFSHVLEGNGLSLVTWHWTLDDEALTYSLSKTVNNSNVSGASDRYKIYFQDGSESTLTRFTFSNRQYNLENPPVSVYVECKLKPTYEVFSDTFSASYIPDPCGPLAFQRTVKNNEDLTRTFAVVEHDPDGNIIHSQFDLSPFSQMPVDVFFDRICNPVSLVEIGDNGTGQTIIEETFLPDAPDPPDPPDNPDTPSSPRPSDLPIEETPLSDILEKDVSDTEKQVESDYFLWKRTDDRQKEIKDVLVDIKDTLQGDGEGGSEEEKDLLLDRLEEIEEGKPDVGDMQSAGQAAAADHADRIPELNYSGSFSGGTAPAWELSIRGITFNMNPFQFAEMRNLADWVRAGFAFFFILSFGLWAHKESTEYLQALPQIQQARGNTFGGTGGQITALIAAGLMTVAIGIALVALMTWASYDFGLGDVASIMGINPFNGTGAVANGVWMLDQFIPLGGFVASFAGRIVWKLTADTAFVIVASVIRFIVP